MMQAASSAKMALRAQQTRMDTIGNNIANVNTAGFKARQVTFKDMLYTTMTRPTNDQTGNLQKGTGVLVASTDLSMTQGIPEMTDNPLDVMIDGDGMLCVQDGAGNLLYTRNGALALSVESDGTYLVNGQGYYVMDENDERIQIPEGTIVSNIEIGTDGTLAVKGETTGFSKLPLYWFPNPAGLDSKGNSCFAESVASGEPTAAPLITSFRQGYLEASNVDAGSEMVMLMRASRAFGFASRAITTADEMDAIANNMRS